jgi:hypothetical protein
MLRLLKVALCLAACVSLTGAAFQGAWYSGGQTGTSTLPIGGAGFLTGTDLAPSDNTKVTRADQYGCWIWNASTSQWDQLMTTSRMPAGSITDITTGAPQGGGCDEIVVDHGTTTNLWMQFGGHLYKSTDKGISFADTAFPVQPAFQGASQHQDVKSLSPYVGVDPNNSSVVYASTPSQGLAFSNDGFATYSMVTSVSAGLPSQGAKGTDSTSVSTCTGVVAFNNNSASFGFSGGDTQYVQVWETGNGANSMFGTVHAASGTTFSLTVLSHQGTCSHSDWSVSYVNLDRDGNGSGSGGGHIVAFDTHGGTTTVGGQTRTKNVYVGTYGVGVFASTDGGATWSLTSSGPTTLSQMVVDPTGILWFIAHPDNVTNNVWHYSGSAWTQTTLTTNAIAVDVDSNSCALEANCHVAVATSNILWYTINGGSSWNEQNGTVTSVSPDAGWIVPFMNGFGFLAVGGIKFDSAGLLWISSEGMISTPPQTSGTAITVTYSIKGIEESEGNMVISAPSASGTAILGGWDIGCWYFSNVSSYPSALTCPNQYVGTLHHVYALDWASSSPTTIVALGDSQNRGTYNNYSGISSSSGTPGTFSNFTAPSSISTNGYIGGCMAASTPLNIVWGGTDGGGGNVAPFYTLDGGSTWTQISVSGVTGGWPFQFYIGSKQCAADRVTANVFYFYNWNTGSVGDAIIKCTSGGASCAIQSNPSLGANLQYNPTIKSVPGNAGHIFLSYGTVAPPQPAVGNGFYYYTDGGVTKNTIANFLGVSAFGFGAIAAGQSYPTITAAGWYNNVYGIWQCQNFNPGANTGTWTKLVDYPNGWALPILDLDGDKGIANRVYGVTGSGQFKINYLLDPANDNNSPMFLARVA